jgi:hypothetical protein
MMTEEQVKARIDALEKQRAEMQANLNAIEGALIVLREVLAPPQPDQPQA